MRGLKSGLAWVGDMKLIDDRCCYKKSKFIFLVVPYQIVFS